MTPTAMTPTDPTADDQDSGPKHAPAETGRSDENARETAPARPNIDRDAALAAAVDFALHQLEDTPIPFWPEHRCESGAEEGDRDAPFMSEALLYPLLGKEDARTLLARYEELVAALGGPAREWRRMLNEAYVARARQTLEIRPEAPDPDLEPKVFRESIREFIPNHSSTTAGRFRLLITRSDPGLVLYNLPLTSSQTIAQRLEAAGFRINRSRIRILRRDELAQG